METKFPLQGNLRNFTYDDDAPFNPLMWLWMVPIVALAPIAILLLTCLSFAPKSVKAWVAAFMDSRG
jgi:hypothetical protein